jgi:hypothetical protein
MDEIPLEETAKEYMMFLLKLINNYLLDNEVPSWFSIKKLTLNPEPPTETDEK